ncbi:MAG TPA: hypothetical protein VIA06_17830 [Candidatus Dormibacteraeota bacterium]|jgi:uncharacterized protein involved in exopolysaccharide biosynthesis|nr:hypothetical protein [Candidatus Dormibacteraeota bacterium]
METFFRHSRVLIALVGISLVVALGISFSAPRVYQSTASLWIQTNSLTGGQNVNTQLSPAQAGVSLLQELMATRGFCLQVAQGGPLYNYVALHGASSNPLSKITSKLSGGAAASGQILQNDVVADLQKNVAVTATGPQVVTVSFNAANPVVAAATVSSLIKQFSDQVQTQLTAQQKLYEQQLSQALLQEQDANAAVARYLAQHPDLEQSVPPPDPTYASLQQVAAQAQERYTQLLAAYDQLLLQQNTGPSSGAFRVMDSPIIPIKPLSRIKTLGLGAGGGLAIGLILCGVTLVLLVVANRGFDAPADVERALGLKVVGIVPLREQRTSAEGRRARKSAGRSRTAA